MMKNGYLLLIISILLSSVQAQAKSSFYTGISFGSATASQACNDESTPPFIGSCDKSGYGLKLLGGYQITKEWGLEISFNDLGEFTAKGEQGGQSVTSSDKVNGINLSGSWTLPLVSEFSAFGRLGVYQWNIDSRATLGAASSSESAQGSSLTFGLGAIYQQTSRISYRLEWERFDGVGEKKTTGQTDINFISVGVLYLF